MKNKIIDIIAKNLKYESLSVDGEESKYEVNIVSDEFDGLSIIQRHKLIYALLDNFIKTGEIHALTIKAKTPSESVS
tara:strand:+ start:9785 stop:10015 length:231 start_codon:yes stop_codon:yes gene_type:complete